MYLLDANLVLSLLQSVSKGKSLSRRHKHFLSVSKQAVNFLWHKKQAWIPINPVIALMELTKQNIKPDYCAYLKLYNELFADIYGIKDVSPAWVFSTYSDALRALVKTQPSVAKTIETVYKLCPSDDSPSDAAAISGCEKFFSWVWEERSRLEFIGGPLMQVCVYAICGSPHARAFIKYSKRSENTAQNVAWDFLFWVMLEIEYHSGIYENSVVCTSDHALADFLSMRVNKGPRGQISKLGSPEFVESYGDIRPPKFKRLENTKLEQEIGSRLVALLTALKLRTERRR
jgi:hypothetical protein